MLGGCTTQWVYNFLPWKRGLNIEALGPWTAALTLSVSRCYTYVFTCMWPPKGNIGKVVLEGNQISAKAITSTFHSCCIIISETQFTVAHDSYSLNCRQMLQAVRRGIRAGMSVLHGMSFYRAFESKLLTPAGCGITKDENVTWYIFNNGPSTAYIQC